MEKYLVGGYVRDKLLGTESADVDYVVVNESPASMRALGYKQVGQHFPVFLHPETGEEYALARAEVSTGKGHADFECSWEGVTLEQDLHRRDFTINAMAMTPDGDIIDPYGGQRDLAIGTLRHVSDHFREDPLRILRGARFAARYSFGMHYDTSKLMKEMVEENMLETLPPERLWGEIEKAMLTTNPLAFFTRLDACGALARVFPEIEAMKGIPQSAQWHAEGNVFIHTLMVLEEATRLTQDLPPDRKIRIRFAALLHDLGKPHTPKELLWDAEGNPIGKHHGHEDPDRFEPSLKALAKRINMPSAIKQFVWKVTVAHQLIHRIKDVGPAGLVSLYERLDCARAMRNDEFFVEDIGLACMADSFGRRVMKDDGSVVKLSKYPQMRFFGQAMFRIAHVSPGDIITQVRDAGYSLDTAKQKVVAAQRRSVKNLVFDEEKEMAMSDCVQCWETPCMCGHDYKDWDEKKLKELIRVLNQQLESRKKPDPVADEKAATEKRIATMGKRLVGIATAIRNEFGLNGPALRYLEEDDVQKIRERLKKFDSGEGMPVSLILCKREVADLYELAITSVQADPPMTILIGFHRGKYHAASPESQSDNSASDEAFDGGIPTHHY